MYNIEREEKERERETDRQTDRQTDRRQTDRQTDRERQRETERDTERETQRETEKKPNCYYPSHMENLQNSFLQLNMICLFCFLSFLSLPSDYFFVLHFK